MVCDDRSYHNTLACMGQDKRTCISESFWIKKKYIDVRVKCELQLDRGFNLGSQLLSIYTQEVRLL